jgi:transcriptional regulator with XRE-family HTH domain
VKKTKDRSRAIHGNIQRLRTSLGLTQAQLGDRVDADKTVVSHWERGESAPAIERLPAVAAALGVTVDALLAPAVPQRASRSRGTARAS